MHFRSLLIKHLRPLSSLTILAFPSAIADDTTRKVGIFSSVFPPRFPSSIAVPAVYVFAATRSAEGAPSFTLEMKVLQRGERKAPAVRFYWYRAILHFLSSRQSSLTFSLFTRRIPPLAGAVFHSSLLPHFPSCLLRTHDSSCSLGHRANYFLSGFAES